MHSSAAHSFSALSYQTNSQTSGSMSLLDFPVEILTQVFENLESDTLKHVYRFLLQEPSVPNAFLDLLLDIYHSRVIITNKWMLRLQTLPRAVRIRSLDELSTWTHYSISELDHIVMDLMSSKYNSNKKVIFAMGIEEKERTPLQIIHKFEDAFKKLDKLSELTQHIKGFYFYMPQTHISQYEVTSLYVKVYRVLRRFQFFAQNLEEIKLHGSWYMKSETLENEVFDFTNFRSLKKFHMNSCCLMKLSQLKLPDTVVDLDLSDNLMASFDNFQLPPKLRRLDLSSNRLAGNFNLRLPITLTSLNLSKNDLMLGSKLPKSLKYLDLSHNSLAMSSINFVSSGIEKIYFDFVQIYLMTKEDKQALTSRSVQIITGGMRSTLNMPQRPNALLYDIQIRM